MGFQENGYLVDLTIYLEEIVILRTFFVGNIEVVEMFKKNLIEQVSVVNFLIETVIGIRKIHNLVLVIKDSIGVAELINELNIKTPCYY